MRIIFSDWVIALDKGRLPRQYDDGEPLEVVNAPDGWAWTLNAQMGGNLDVIPLSVSDGVVGTTLSKSQLALAGDYLLQLIGVKDSVTRHTNIISMAVPKSLSGDATWPTLPTAFSDALDRAEDAADRAESAATHGPRISGTNTWEVWDPDKGQYVDTMVDASGKTGPQGPAGVDGTTPDIKIGTVTTLEPGADATVSIGGTVAEPVLSLGIPRGAKGDKGDSGGSSDVSLDLTSVTVGQTIKVKAVDDNGHPTAWNAIDRAWKLHETYSIKDMTFPAAISIPQKKDVLLIFEGVDVTPNKETNLNVTITTTEYDDGYASRFAVTNKFFAHSWGCYIRMLLLWRENTQSFAPIAQTASSAETYPDSTKIGNPLGGSAKRYYFYITVDNADNLNPETTGKVNIYVRDFI